MLDEHDLGGVPLFVLPRPASTARGCSARGGIAQLKRLARAGSPATAEARAAVVRQTVGGAVDALTATW
jgi:hypothetical protein